MQINHSEMALIIYLCVLAIYLFYKWAVSTFDHFEKQGIPFRKPIPFFGTNANFITRKKDITESLTEWYNEFEHEK